MSIYGGPFPMGHVPERCAANGCESKTTSSDQWLRCQGADDCLARMCPNHEDESRCTSCDLPCCEAHRYQINDGRLCQTCLRLAAASDDDAVMMVLACRIMAALEADMDLEVCDQDTAADLSIMARSGCTIAEAAAAMRGKGSVN